VGDAFAPIGVVIDAWAEEMPVGETREFPVVVLNDLPEPRKASVRFQILHGEQAVFDASQACEVKAYETTRLAFKAPAPKEPGKYQLAAEMRVVGGETVRSLRDFEALSREQIDARYGVARNKPVSASSSLTLNGESFPAALAVDGNVATRWSSEFSDPQWIAIDLGEPITVSRVELLWEHASAKAYKIQVSADGQTWTDVHATDAGAGGKEDIRFAPVQARWVRMLGTQRATPFGYSLWEFRVFR
jgi:hypothetical protein